MHLKKIVLRNFRCFEQLELELHPRLNVIVGNNGIGKTTILEALVAGLTPVIRGFSTAALRLSTKSLGLKCPICPS
jgi:predicted ATP-binding protein involved in virulence